MIDLVSYYAKRKDKALKDGDKRLAASYAHLEEAERIARSGKLPDRESVLLSPSIAFICLHAGGAVSPSAATAGASSTSTGTSAPAAARTSWTAGTSPSSATSTFDAQGARGQDRPTAFDEGRWAARSAAR